MGKKGIWRSKKRILSLLICLCVVALLFVPFSISAQGGKGKKNVRVGWYESAYCYTDSLGRRTGLAYEYQRKIAAYSDWEYEYVEGTWPELMEMLRTGQIDLLSDVSYTEERAQEILYPDYPMGEESYYIYIKSEDSPISVDDVQSVNGKRIGVNKGSIQSQFLKDWAAENNVTPQIIEILSESESDFVDLLDSGALDAFASTDIYGDLDVCSPVTRIGESEYYFAVSKYRTELLADLNAALRRIQSEDPYYNRNLYKKYIDAVSASAFLSDAEKIWMNSHRKIVIGYRDDYLPYCDQDEKTGTSTGIMIDFLEEASQCMLNGTLYFKTKPYATVEEAMDALEAGEVDCIFPINMGVYDAEQKGLLLTNSLLSSEMYAAVNRGNKKSIANDTDNVVAVREGNENYVNFVRDYYPEWEIRFYKDKDACYKAVEDGEADLALISGYRIDKNDRQRVKYGLSLLDTGYIIDSCFAIREDDTELYSVMNKAINLVGEKVVESSINKYTYEEKITFHDYMRDNLSLVIAVTSTIIIIILLLVLQQYKTDKRAAERQALINATELDSISGLYNQNFFYEYASRMFFEHPDMKYDAIALNLDQFHSVNALNGWEFGDIVLSAIGEEIIEFLEKTDGIACRTQADRFEIYCLQQQDYKPLYNRIQNKLDKLSQNVSMRLRMGVMPWQEGMIPVQQLDHARTACKIVRNGNFDGMLVFNDEMRQREMQDQILLNDFRRAIDEKEFIVFYQPKYDIQSNPPKLCGAEALVRWNHHERGMIPPNEFIPLFEKNAKICTLDKYVWKEAAQQIAQWKDKYGLVLPVSVNLSRLDVFDPDLEQLLENIVNENDIGRGALDLEVTESAYTDDSEKLLSIVTRLRDKGHRIEMDDFGTGYSSLNMLSSMPVDILKLDRSFIKNMEIDERDIRMVELILDIAKGMKIPVVAEGVETKEQVEFLKKRGCEMVQGYYFSRPLPPDEFEELIKASLR